MTREEAIKTLKDRIEQYTGGVHPGEREILLEAFAALREKAERERGWGCAYCVIGRRSPDARYCSNCGRKLPPALPEEVNPDSHQYVDNDSTNRRKTVKQIGRNLYSETARCDYCGRFTKDSDLTDYWIRENYWICKRCKEKRT